MTALLSEARRLLVTSGVGASGASTSTTSIFTDSLPEWPGVSIVLASAPGMEGDRHYGNGVPDIERPRIEMLVRSTAMPGGKVPTAANAKAAANSAYRVLVAVANTSLAASSSATATRWLNVEAESGPPYLFDRDPSGRIYYRCLFLVDREST